MDSFDDEESSLPERRTLLHSKELLANFAALVERPIPAFVAVAGGNSIGQLFQLRDGVTVGRAIGVDVPLREEGVSRRHATIRVDGEQRVFVADAGSSNGVFVNGARVTAETEIKEGDFVQLGSTILMLIFLASRGPVASSAEVPARDPITLLPRRSEFLRDLEAEFVSTRNHRGSLHLVMFAVEGLARMEIAGGPNAVDDVLAKIARAVRDAIQGDDHLVARYSDDEFAIVLPDAASEDAGSLASWLKFLPRTGNTRPASAAEPTYEICVGVAALNSTHVSTNDLVTEARRALYADRGRALNASRPAKH